MVHPLGGNKSKGWLFNVPVNPNVVDGDLRVSSPGYSLHSDLRLLYGSVFTISLPELTKCLTTTLNLKVSLISSHVPMLTCSSVSSLSSALTPSNCPGVVPCPSSQRGESSLKLRTPHLSQLYILSPHLSSWQTTGAQYVFVVWYGHRKNGYETKDLINSSINDFWALKEIRIHRLLGSRGTGGQIYGWRSKH